MLSLYSKEPENIGKAYSVNFESFLTIQKVDVHKYKITLPDGSYNYYCYKDGLLNIIEVHHGLYSANIVLVNHYEGKIPGKSIELLIITSLIRTQAEKFKEFLERLYFPIGIGIIF